MNLMVFVGLFLLIISSYSITEIYSKENELSILGIFGVLLNFSIILLCL